MGSVAWLIDGDWRVRRLMAVRPVCVDHMTLPVGDLERSVAFYRAALVLGMDWVERTIDGSPTFGPAGAEDVSLVAGGPLAPPIHLAFAATSYEQIEGFHREGLAAGGRDNGAPGPRPKYSPGYYGAFLLDPDGHNVEAVWHAPDEG
jgi:catechol 2,3-dioxygenase-like lactoylglutathione lyase family enzyme